MQFGKNKLKLQTFYTEIISGIESKILFFMIYHISTASFQNLNNYLVFSFSINCILSIESDVIAMLTPEAKNDQAPVNENFLPLKVSVDLSVRPHLFKLNNSNLNNISKLKLAATLSLMSK